MGSIEDALLIPVECEGTDHEIHIGAELSSGNSERIPTIRVRLGSIRITEGAFRALEAAGQSPLSLLARHHFGDWGELEAEDWERNNHAFAQALRLLSSYRLRDGTMLWVITEADRLQTTLLTPEEY